MNEVKENRIEKQSRFNKGFYIGLGISFAVEAIIAVAIFLYEYYAVRFVDNILTSAELNNMLADVFILPSILCILFYCIMFVSKEGAFDAIAYASKLVFYSIFAKNTRETKLPATYGEYRALKMGKTRSSSLFLLFSAIPFFIVGIIFVILAGVNYTII
jgi:hypothetical protein